MATSVTITPPLWTDGMTFNSVTGRTNGQALLAGNGTTSLATPLAGVVNNIANALKVVPVSGMNISVNAGYAFVPNLVGGTANGSYRVSNISSASLTVATSDPTNPRIDSVFISVQDNGDATSFAAVQIVTGTPAPSPVAPSIPGGLNALLLANIAVAAGTSTISAGNITDSRVYTVAAGGVVPWSSAASSAGGFPGRIGYDIAANRFFHDNGTTPAKQIALKPWTSSKAYYAGASKAFGAGTATLSSVNITVDGNTDIDIWLDIYGFETSGSSGASSFLEFHVDATSVCRMYLGVLANTGLKGGTFHWQTGSESSDTPSAGAHTVSAVAVGGASCDAHSPWKLVVSPVFL